MNNKNIISYDIEKEPIYENDSLVEFLDDNGNLIQGFFKFNNLLFRYELFVTNDSHNSHFYIFKGKEKIKIIGKN